MKRSVLTLSASVLIAVAFLVGVRADPYAKTVDAAPQPATRPAGNGVRVAVIGGMFETGFWNALAERYEKETGVRVELIAAGPKEQLDKAFKERGGIDLITMHSSDTIINLVADGYATDPQPWLRNDLVIVGPAADPAGIKGMTDAAEALRKIAAAKAPFVVHSSLGAQEVLRGVLDRNGIALDPQQTTVLFADNQRSVLKIAAEKDAYTLVGRIPFRSGKLPNAGLILMVAGDERLRRPYVVAVANAARFPDARVVEAKRFAEYLFKPETQAWVAEFGRGKLDDQPLFFPVARSASGTTRPAPGVLLTVRGDVEEPLQLTADMLAKMPRRQVSVKDRDGTPMRYGGVALRTILTRAGVPLGNHRMRGEQLSRYLVAEARDGYRVVFALPEFDAEFAERNIIVADEKNGQPLDATEGPLRLVVPDESRQARWARQLVSLILKRE